VSAADENENENEERRILLLIRERKREKKVKQKTSKKSKKDSRFGSSCNCFLGVFCWLKKKRADEKHAKTQELFVRSSNDFCKKSKKRRKKKKKNLSPP